MSTDHFANLKHAIKHDSTQVIIAILQLPLFAFAIIGICNTAKAFPGSDSDCAQYIGMTHLAEPKGKPKLKKVKVTPSLTNFKLSSDAMLSLLGQIDVTLKNCLLNEDNTAPLAKLQRHCEAINLATQKQLYSLDFSLQTFCYISTWPECMDKKS
ncbi:hypothetical protein C0989_008021 [Termitomyces sp. Mn162]|nr:hypothetical protein C0989_008021 [Termitomyces sp. Mn162]